MKPASTKAPKDEAEWQKQAAMSLAREAGGYAAAATSDVTTMLKDYIQRGPQGVGWLCFVGGLVTFVFGMLGTIDIFAVISSPLTYLINVYQMAFGAGTCVIEAPEEWVPKYQRLQRMQAFTHRHAKFLTTFGGRGLFYIFQGSLALSLSGVMSLSGILAMYMFLLGVMCIMMQYGYKPDFSSLNTSGSSSSVNHESEYIRIN
eukprot:TRINITY_DN124541_c0_g1_i1.p1 TRINITY_DN124541_c0_g1~~TRINITY_DN124541_c0_g1_i1.p1  ORF type:complete len:203 (-),score=48.94 TRINITY_DN124541_c0_g1_i1:103-711(-)